MSIYRVDLASLEEFTDALRRFDEHLTALRDEVEAQLATLRIGWTGAAADEHQKAHRMWQRGAAESAQGLTALHRVTGTAHGNYGAAVAAGRAMWAG